MSQFTLYRSTDASAPTLSGTAGDLTNLLDACLVNGYTGKAAAGWSISYTSTNRRAYKNGTGSTGLLWRVRDDAGGTGGAKEALVRGYETMSDVNTGTNPFPTVAGTTDSSLMIRKSATADATTRPWIVVSDAKTCYVFIQTGDLSNTYLAAMMGDYYSVVSGDTWNATTVARSSENSAAVGSSNGLSDLDTLSATLFNTFITGFVSVRNHLGVAQSGGYAYSRCSTWSRSTQGLVTAGTGGLSYPNPSDNSIYLSRVFVGPYNISPATLRGYFRGLWDWLHAGGVNDGDTFSGSGDLAGKTFLVIKGSPNGGVFIIETSNTLP